MDHHGGMDHGGMDHGGSSGPPAMEHFPGCTMRMLWNADTTSTCIIHPALRVQGAGSLLFYMAVLFLCAFGYERLRQMTAANDQRLRTSYLDKQGRPILPSASAAGGSSSSSSGESVDPERRPLLITPLLLQGPRSFLPTNEKLFRSGLYTLNVGISFAIMLVIMTYNVYLITAVLAGAFAGHLFFHSDFLSPPEDRGMACH